VRIWATERAGASIEPPMVFELEQLFEAQDVVSGVLSSWLMWHEVGLGTGGYLVCSLPFSAAARATASRVTSRDVRSSPPSNEAACRCRRSALPVVDRGPGVTVGDPVRDRRLRSALPHDLACQQADIPIPAADARPVQTDAEHARSQSQSTDFCGDESLPAVSSISRVEVAMIFRTARLTRTCGSAAGSLLSVAAPLWLPVQLAGLCDHPGAR